MSNVSKIFLAGVTTIHCVVNDMDQVRKLFESAFKNPNSDDLKSAIMRLNDLTLKKNRDMISKITHDFVESENEDETIFTMLADDVDRMTEEEKVEKAFWWLNTLAMQDEPDVEKKFTKLMQKFGSKQDVSFVEVGSSVEVNEDSQQNQEPQQKTIIGQTSKRRTYGKVAQGILKAVMGVGGLSFICGAVLLHVMFLPVAIVSFPLIALSSTGFVSGLAALFGHRWINGWIFKGDTVRFVKIPPNTKVQFALKDGVTQTGYVCKQTLMADNNPKSSYNPDGTYTIFDKCVNKGKRGGRTGLNLFDRAKGSEILKGAEGIEDEKLFKKNAAKMTVYVKENGEAIYKKGSVCPDSFQTDGSLVIWNDCKSNSNRLKILNIGPKETDVKWDQLHEMSWRRKYTPIPRSTFKFEFVAVGGLKANETFDNIKHLQGTVKDIDHHIVGKNIVTVSVTGRDDVIKVYRDYLHVVKSGEEYKFNINPAAEVVPEAIPLPTPSPSAPVVVLSPALSPAPKPQTEAEKAVVVEEPKVEEVEVEKKKKKEKKEKKKKDKKKSVGGEKNKQMQAMAADDDVGTSSKATSTHSDSRPDQKSDEDDDQVPKSKGKKGKKKTNETKKETEKVSGSSTFFGGMCFAGSSEVMTPSGPKRLSHTLSGDHVLTASGYEPVIGFLHAHERSAVFLEIVHGSGSLRVTPGHIVFLASGMPVPAYSLTAGDNLSCGPVLQVRKVVLPDGVYAPITQSGTLVVDGVLSSNYAVVDSLMSGGWHSIFHLLVSPLRWMGSSGISPGVHALFPSSLSW